MKKYGQADLMCYLVQMYLTTHMKSATDEEKKKIEDRCFSEIMANYPSEKDFKTGN